MNNRKITFKMSLSIQIQNMYNIVSSDKPMISIYYKTGATKVTNNDNNNNSTTAKNNNYHNYYYYHPYMTTIINADLLDWSNLYT